MDTRYAEFVKINRHMVDLILTIFQCFQMSSLKSKKNEKFLYLHFHFKLSESKISFFGFHSEIKLKLNFLCDVVYIVNQAMFGNNSVAQPHRGTFSCALFLARLFRKGGVMGIACAG